MKWKKQENKKTPQVRSIDGITARPDSKKPSKKPSIKKKPSLKSILLVFIIIFLGAAGYLMWQNLDRVNGLTRLINKGGSLISKPVEKEPDFSTIGKDKNSGNYDENREIFSFQATVNDTDVVVTQQPLPEELKSSENKVEKLALSLHNSKSINRLKINGDIAYLVEVGDTGQIVVASINDILIFIRTEGELTTQQWQNYIDNLIQ